MDYGFGNLCVTADEHHFRAFFLIVFSYSPVPRYYPQNVPPKPESTDQCKPLVNEPLCVNRV